MAEHAPRREQPTTTHATRGSGHPRLLISREDHRYVYAITEDLTRVGSSPDNEVVLPGAADLHATITHDAVDEYVLTMLEAGETNAARLKAPGPRRHPAEVLRTGAYFTAGPWRLVFARDEFADHGRPYGGRQGGEGAHQKRQAPRPAYTLEHPLSHDQVILIDEVVNGADAPAFEFYVVKDHRAGRYSAMIGETAIGGLAYRAEEDRLVLEELSVEPKYRDQGIATDLTRRVLDDIRVQGGSITVLCPIVRTFIDRNPEYAVLVDAAQPGVTVIGVES